MSRGLNATAFERDDRLVLADFLPFRLARTAQTVSKLIADTCEERFGLSIPAWRLLCLLAEEKGLDDQTLGVRAALTEPQRREAAAALLAQGLAVRDDDARLVITGNGLGAHEDLAGLALAAEAALLSQLSPDDVRQLHRLLSRLEGAALRLSGRG